MLTAPSCAVHVTRYSCDAYLSAVFIQCYHAHVWDFSIKYSLVVHCTTVYVTVLTRILTISYYMITYGYDLQCGNLSNGTVSILYIPEALAVGLYTTDVQ